MKESKLLIQPVFKSIPQSTAANVEENIIHWISNGDNKSLRLFCRECFKCKHGFRFISTEDLDETIITYQTIQGINFDIIWFRRLHTIDSFCPLWFSEWYIICTLVYKDVSFEFKSDNDLKKRIRKIKNNL